MRVIVERRLSVQCGLLHLVEYLIDRPVGVKFGASCAVVKVHALIVTVVSHTMAEAGLNARTGGRRVALRTPGLGTEQGTGWGTLNRTLEFHQGSNAAYAKGGAQRDGVYIDDVRAEFLQCASQPRTLRRDTYEPLAQVRAV